MHQLGAHLNRLLVSSINCLDISQETIMQSKHQKQHGTGQLPLHEPSTEKGAPACEALAEPSYLEREACIVTTLRISLCIIVAIMHLDGEAHALQSGRVCEHREDASDGKPEVPL